STNRHELTQMMQNVYGVPRARATKRRHSAVATESRPGDKAQFVRLHQARMRGHDAHAKAVGAAFGSGNAPLIHVIPIPIGLAGLIEYSRVWIADVAIVYLAVICFDAHMLRVDCAEMDARSDLQ